MSNVIYVRIASEVKAALVEEAEQNARTISAQLTQILRERYKLGR